MFAFTVPMVGYKARVGYRVLERKYTAPGQKRLVAIKYTQKDTKRFESTVRLCARQQCPDLRPVEPPTGVGVLFHVFRKRPPKNHTDACCKKPDLDNTLKAILDALNGVAWQDDRQVVQITGRKQWDDCPEDHIVVMIFQGVDGLTPMRVEQDAWRTDHSQPHD